MNAQGSSLSILYLGTKNGTSLDRARAYERLGHFVHHIDLRALLPESNWIDRITWHVGGDRLSAWVERRLRKELAARLFDLCHVDGGELVTPATIQLLRTFAGKIVNYNIDDPLGPRDGSRWRAYRQSVPHYDLCVVVRSVNATQARMLGAKDVLRVHMAADEIVHAPRQLTAQDHREWDSEVSFIGAWFPERGPFLYELVKRSIPLTIRGNRWMRAAEWPSLKDHWKGPAIYGEGYAKAIQCAKVNLGLLSKANRDFHTTRSLEVPALGGLLCAERTAEHLSMYEEGKEALFWEDAAECALQCEFALSNPDASAAIAAAGRKRIHVNGDFNEPIMESIIRRIIPSEPIRHDAKKRAS